MDKNKTGKCWALTEGKKPVVCGAKLEAALKKYLCLLLLQMEHQSLSSCGNKNLKRHKNSCLQNGKLECGIAGACSQRAAWFTASAVLSMHNLWHGDVTGYENLPAVCDISLRDRSHEYTNGNHSQEDQQEGPSLDGKIMSGMIWRRWSLWSGHNKYRTAPNGRLFIVKKAKTLSES